MTTCLLYRNNRLILNLKKIFSSKKLKNNSVLIENELKLRYNHLI